MAVSTLKNDAEAMSKSGTNEDSVVEKPSSIPSKTMKNVKLIRPKSAYKRGRRVNKEEFLQQFNFPRDMTPAEWLREYEILCDQHDQVRRDYETKLVEGAEADVKLAEQQELQESLQKEVECLKQKVNETREQMVRAQNDYAGAEAEHEKEVRNVRVLTETLAATKEKFHSFTDRAEAAKKTLLAEIEKFRVQVKSRGDKAKVSVEDPENQRVKELQETLKAQQKEIEILNEKQSGLVEKSNKLKGMFKKLKAKRAALKEGQ